MVILKCLFGVILVSFFNGFIFNKFVFVFDDDFFDVIYFCKDFEDFFFCFRFKFIVVEE